MPYHTAGSRAALGRRTELPVLSFVVRGLRLNARPCSPDIRRSDARRETSQAAEMAVLILKRSRFRALPTPRQVGDSKLID